MAALTDPTVLWKENHNWSVPINHITNKKLVEPVDLMVYARGVCNIGLRYHNCNPDHRGSILYCLPFAMCDCDHCIATLNFGGLFVSTWSTSDPQYAISQLPLGPYRGRFVNTYLLRLRYPIITSQLFLPRADLEQLTFAFCNKWNVGPMAASHLVLPHLLRVFPCHFLFHLSKSNLIFDLL